MIWPRALDTHEQSGVQSPILLGPWLSTADTPSRGLHEALQCRKNRIILIPKLFARVMLIVAFQRKQMWNFHGSAVSKSDGSRGLRSVWYLISVLDDRISVAISSTTSSNILAFHVNKNRYERRVAGMTIGMFVDPLMYRVRTRVAPLRIDRSPARGIPATALRCK